MTFAQKEIQRNLVSMRAKRENKVGTSPLPTPHTHTGAYLMELLSAGIR